MKNNSIDFHSLLESFIIINKCFKGLGSLASRQSEPGGESWLYFWIQLSRAWLTDGLDTAEVHLGHVPHILLLQLPVLDSQQLHRVATELSEGVTFLGLVVV